MNKPRVFAADILRVLDALPDSEQAAACRAAGFDPVETAARLPVSDERDLLPRPPGGVEEPPPSKPRSDTATGFGPIFWRVAQDLPIPPASRQQQPPAWLTNEAASFETKRYVSSKPSGERLPTVPLVSVERFTSFVSAYLRPYLAGQAPDLPRAVERIASGRSVHPLPRLVRRKWPACVQVVLDLSGVLTPFRVDLLSLLDQLCRLLDGRIEVLMTRSGEPDEWLQASGLTGRLRFDGSPVVVLGDAGSYRPGSGLQRRWAALARQFGTVGVRPLLLAPVPLRLMPDELREVFDVALLGEGRGLSLLGGYATDGHQGEQARVRCQRGLDHLRAALFGNSYVSWRLVRQLRLALQDSPGNEFAVDIGTEVELWQDGGVCSVATGCALAADAVEPALAVLRQLRASQPEVISRFVALHLAELTQGSPLLHAIFVSEVLRSGLVTDDDLQAHGQSAEALLTDLARCLQSRPSARDERELAGALGDFIGGLSLRAPGAVGRGDDALQTAWALARAEDIREGRVGLPEGLRLDQLDWLIQPDRVLSGPLHLVAVAEASQNGMEGVGLRLELTEASPSLPVPSALIRNLEDELPVTIVPVEARDVDARQLLVPGRALHLSGGQAYRIATRRREIVIEAFERPAWAKSVGFVDGYFRAVQQIGGELAWVPRQKMHVLAHEPRPIEGESSALSASVVGDVTLPHAGWWDIGGPENPLDVFLRPPAWAVRHGTDEFGFWAEFDVKGRSSTVTQRCRWIAPGTFLMGSPPDEVDWRSDEIQHEVALTRGYWLADTACTQALWQAVMGDNPSHFKGDPANPVEQVSGNDVQTCLDRLNNLVPGLAAGLPSEAQWENACRAGTTTPFSFGKNITPEQVNYDGNNPYADGKTGLYRRRTVPVKSLPPNPWGLYEMHGNVLEWCADWYGDYTKGPQIDPPGRPEGVERVLRGGSWSGRGKLCRAAYRDWYDQGFRDFTIGFRLAPGQKSGPAGQEAARRAKGASAMRSVAEQAPAERAGPVAGGAAGGRGTKPRSKKGRKKP